MAEKKIQARIRQKVDTKANWDKATNFVPLKGEYIYYSDLHKVKVGDGVTKVGSLPFLADSNSITGMYIGATNAKANAATTNGNTYLKLYDDNTKRAEFLIKGSGATKVSSDANGNITISSTDTNTDTHFTTGLYVGKADEKSNSATTNGNTYLKLFDNDTRRAQHLINGGGATTVTSNASGSIEIATPIKTLDTTSGSGLGNGRSENIAGSGTIYLHKVAKTGSYNDLSNKPTIPNTSNLVPYTGATKDVDLGKHSLSISNKSDGKGKITVSSQGISENDIYCEITSTGMQLMDPNGGTSYNVNYIDNFGFKVYLPNATYMPSGAEVFAMKSNLSNLLDKGSASTNNNQIVYNPVEMKKALTVPSIQTTPIQYGPTDFESAVSIGSTTINGNAAAQIRLVSPGLGNATITVDSGVFSIASGTTLACDGGTNSPWTVDGSPIITAKNMTNYLSVQQWKLTSTSGAVTTINICTK